MIHNFSIKAHHFPRYFFSNSEEMKLKVTAQEFKEIFSISTSGSPQKASLSEQKTEEKTEEKPQQTNDNDRRGNDNSRNNEEKVKEKENRDRDTKNKNNSASMQSQPEGQEPMQPQPVTTIEQTPMQPIQPQPIIAMGQSPVQPMQPPNEAQKQDKDRGKIPYDIDTLVAMQVQAVATANALEQSIQNLSQDAPAQQKPKVPIPPTISPQLSEPDISAQIPTSTAPNLSENIVQTASLATDATKTQNFPVQGCIAAVGNENRVSSEKREESR